MKPFKFVFKTKIINVSYCNTVYCNLIYGNLKYQIPNRLNICSKNGTHLLT